MGNAKSIVELDYTRSKKGKWKQELKKNHVPKIKSISAKALSDLFSYLDKHVQIIARQVELLNKNQEWERQYLGITDGNGSPAEASLNPANAHLNRYRNIVAYDASRVHVQPNARNGMNDYINANWIPGFKQERGYIAAQGPVPDSIPAFWQMVWESGSTCIVMVTNEIEGNKLKCHRYWPAREAPTQKFGAMTVTLTGEIVKSTYIHSKLELKQDKKVVNVDHFQFTVWPDHGVPNSTAELISFRKEIRRLHPHPAPPITVHCSAGVGRSGTFIVVDTIMNKAEFMDDSLDVRTCISTIRQARNYMVQTVTQYQFCFKAVLDALERAQARTVRVVQNKSDEIANLQHDIQELQYDVGEAMEEYTGDMYADQLMSMGEQVQMSGGIRPDVRWSAFNREEDLAPATAIPGSMRIEALSAQSGAWQDRQNVPRTAQEKGYDGKHSANLIVRVDSLAINSDPDAWKNRYAEVAGSWVSDVYDLTAHLNPLESRMMSLANQRENWKLRGEAYRKQIEEDTKSIVADLGARIQSLSEIITRSEDRWRTNGDGMRGKSVVEHQQHTVDHGGSFEDRLNNLVQWVNPEAVKARGTTGGREVESPEKVRQRERAEREAAEAERRKSFEEMEQKRIAKEKEERRQREEEAKRKAQKPVKAAQYNIDPRTPKQLVKLKSAKKADESVHPMIAQADDLSKGGSRRRRSSAK